MANKPHPGITMHKLTVGGEFAGLVFAVGTVLIFVFGLPALWYFVVFSVAFGVGIALLLHIVNVRREDRRKPLSILAIPQAKPEPPAKREGQPRLLHTAPALRSA